MATKKNTLTLRDRQALGFIARHGAADYDQLARILRPKAPLAERSVRHNAAKWEQMGLIKREKVENGRPVVVYLTPKGQREIGAEHPLGTSLAGRSVADILEDGWRELAETEVSNVG